LTSLPVPNENRLIEARALPKAEFLLPSVGPPILVSVDSTGEGVRAGSNSCPLPFVFRGGLRIAFPKCMPEEDKKNIKERPAGRSRGLVFVIPIVLLAGVGIWFWANRGTEASPSEATRVRSTLHLETFVLNLADTDQRSYLRVGIDLGLNQEVKRGETAPVAQVRDTILGVLAEAKVNDLMTVTGKTKLKENLLHALQERMPQLGVAEVYFTEFLIQR